MFLSHRGESDDAPENTLPAFELAMQRQSDGIELDVRLTADKQVVCVHDDSLQRVAGVPLKVAEHDLQELQKYHPVPLLQEALQLLAPGALMQIELKGAPELIPWCKQLLDKFPEKRSCFCISSFESDTITVAADGFGDLPRVLLVDLEKVFGYFPTAEEVIKYLAPLKCGISFKADMRADADFVQKLKADGLRVVCWGVFTDELGLKMAEIGVDALTCNHAVALRKKYLELKKEC